MNTQIRVMIVDDHALVRSGFRSILEADARFEVVAEAANGEDAVAYLAHHPVDVVLMDVRMPGIGGIEATRKLARVQPNARVIAVTVLSDEPFPNQLLDAGAWGYLSKGCPAKELTEAIETVAAGEHYLATDIARTISLAKLSNRGDGSPLALLSNREMQVMMMITQGRGTQDISDSLFLSPKTVSTYRHRLYEKLGVQNDVELTHFAMRHGLLDASP